jgi:FkbM family methyltransferase
LRGVVPAVEHISALENLNPGTVIDIGANKGQFSVVARHLFPTAKIHAFEPLEREREILQRILKAPVQIHPFAIGATKERKQFYVTSRADSSSLLMPGKSQTEAYGVKLSSKIFVDVATLSDTLIPEDLVSPVLLKLDVQGGELPALLGAKSMLKAVDAVYCEVSFVELYDQQSRAGTIVSFLEEQGFSLRGVYNLSTTRRFGPTQADFLFLRRVPPPL